MRVIDIEKAKNSDRCEDIFLSIVLSDDNIRKVSMKVLYMIERGFSNFLFDFESAGLTLEIDRILFKVQNQIFALVNSHEIKIAIKGFSKCVFNRKFLPAHMRYDFASKILYYDSTDEINTKCDEFICFKDCDGEGFVNSYEEMPEYTIEDHENLILEEFAGFWNENLKEASEICLKDYLENSKFSSRKIFFRERISHGSDDFREGFFYRIFNEPDKFEEIYDFMRYFLGPKLEMYKEVLKKSTNFVLTFEVQADDKLRKRLFFSTTRSKNYVEDLLFSFNVTSPNLERIYGLDIDFTDGPQLYEIHYVYEKMDAFKIKRFFDRYELESKLLLFKFLNSTTKDLTNILIRDTYENGMLVSKKLDVGCCENLIKVKRMGILFGLNVGHLMEKETSTIILEVSEFSPVKIIFNYSPSLPIRIPLIVENTEEENCEESCEVEG